MRSKDKTKAECLAIWNKHKANPEGLNFESGSSHTWTNEQKLAYIEKMIERIENDKELI